MGGGLRLLGWVSVSDCTADMSCCEDEEIRRQRIHSHHIDSQLVEDHKRLQKFHNVLVIGQCMVNSRHESLWLIICALILCLRIYVRSLGSLLGPKGSGKSSIIKQIKISHGGYSKQWVDLYRFTVYIYTVYNTSVWQSSACISVQVYELTILIHRERLEEAKNIRASIRHITEVYNTVHVGSINFHHHVSHPLWRFLVSLQILITELDQSNPPLILESQSNIPKLHYIQDYIHNLPSNHSNFPKVIDM